MRVPDLRAFRLVIDDLACGGLPFDARDRLVLVPTRAAAAAVVGAIERQRLRSDGAVALPDFATRDELHSRLAQRMPSAPQMLTTAEREVLMGVACRAACEDGVDPPFRLRPGLVAAVIDFYDTLRRNLRPVEAFARLALGVLEPGAAEDRGAERLVHQTRFLTAAFRRFERLCRETGRADEHSLREHVIATAAAPPWRHVVVTVSDRMSDPHGLFASDWDLLARIPGLERLDVVVTEAVLAGACHERIHQVLPGIEEVRFECDAAPALPVLVVPPGGSLVHTARDREEEVAGFARWVRRQRHALSRTALVVRRPLPYLYLAREVLRSAGIPSQMFDALPLAAEPFAAALDIVLATVTGNFARRPAVALLRSPHFRFAADEGTPRLRAIAQLDRALSEAGYLGGVDVLEGLVARWDGAAESGSAPAAAARRLGHELLDAAQALSPLRAASPCAEHLTRLIDFVTSYERRPPHDDPLSPRLMRGRAAVLDVLAGLRDAYARFDSAPADFEALIPIIRRCVEERTFSPYTGAGGVHVVDVDSARFGDFDVVQLAGLVDGEWPERPRRNIFYPQALLRDLGWPLESQRLEYARAAFGDLLRLPSSQLAVSSFTLEEDVMVAASPLVDDLAASGLQTVEQAPALVRIFEYEALSSNPVELQHVGRATRAAALRRIMAAEAQPDRTPTAGHPLPAYAVSALERYQDCPFRFFAADVLRLEEPPEDDAAVSPRTRGKFVHEVFHRFFEAWDARGLGTITANRLSEARALFEEVAAPMLARLSDAESALESARLFGTAASVGMVDVVLELEASRTAEVRGRLLEFRLEGEFSLGAVGGRRVALKGVADRIDLLAGDRLRVIDYKSGYPPNPKRALQVAVYGLCAQERLEQRDGRRWVVDEAAYVAFSGKRTFVPVVRHGASDGAAVLNGARDRLLDVVDGIEGGVFPPRPYDPHICTYCAYPLVCRKDYVGDQ